AGDLSSTPLHFLASLVSIVHCDGDVAEGVAELVLVHAPVVGQFDPRRIGFVAVADESQGEFALWVVIAAEQPHAENLGVEAQRSLQIGYSQHGVEDSHGCFPYRSGRVGARAFNSRRAARKSGYSSATIPQKRGEWLSSRRWASSCAAT